MRHTSYETVGRLRLRREVDLFTFLVTEYDLPSRAPLHDHAEASLTFVLEGGYEERVCGLSPGLRAGTLLFKPPGEPHGNRFTTPAATLLLQFPGRSRALASFDLAILERPFVLATPFAAEFGRRLRAELDLREDGDPCSDLSLTCWTHELLGYLGSHLRADPRRQDSVASLARDWVHAYYRRRLDLRRLAQELGVTASHLARRFRADFGCTLGQYQRQLRIARVLRQLAGDDDSLANVALDAGFVDQSHLNRVFRRHVGLTPGSYRKAVRGRRRSARKGGRPRPGAEPDDR